MVPLLSVSTVNPRYGVVVAPNPARMFVPWALLTALPPSPRTMLKFPPEITTEWLAPHRGVGALGPPYNRKAMVYVPSVTAAPELFSNLPW